MSNKDIVQIKHLVQDKNGVVSFKKLATSNMGCVEELITDGEHKGKTFVTVYGLQDKPSSQIVPAGISFCSTTTLDFLREIKNNGLVGLKRIEPDKEIRFDFNETSIKSFNLVFPEEVFCYIFEDINAVYVTKAIDLDLDDNKVQPNDTSLMNLKDQLCNEIHINNEQILFMIDYSNKEAYALTKDLKEIMNCEFEGNDPEDKFKRVRLGDTILRYEYNPIGYLDKIVIESNEDDNEYGYFLKIDEYDEKYKRREHVTVTYVVPYIKDTGTVLVYSENCRLYRTDNIYIERGKVLEWQIEYRILSDEEEADINDAFFKTLENSEFILSKT